MKKFLNGFGFCFLIMTIVLFAFAAFAQLAGSPIPSATPMPVVIPPAPTTGSVFIAAIEIIKSWGTLGVFAGIAAALKLLVDATKAIGLFDKIPQAYQSLFVLGVGTLTVGLTALAAGATLPMAIGASISSSAAAMLFHELCDDLLGLLKKKFPPATVG